MAPIIWVIAAWQGRAAWLTSDQTQLSKLVLCPHVSITQSHTWSMWYLLSSYAAAGAELPTTTALDAPLMSQSFVWILLSSHLLHHGPNLTCLTVDMRDQGPVTTATNLKTRTQLDIFISTKQQHFCVKGLIYKYTKTWSQKVWHWMDSGSGWWLLRQTDLLTRDWS